MFDPHLQKLTLEATGASRITDPEVIQSLWSGYGKILRCGLRYADAPGPPSVVVKHVHWPTTDNHPHGWNTDHSHERKVKSYQVETAWYQHFASACSEDCRVPHCLALATQGNEVFIVMEDLDASGFDQRRSTVSDSDVDICLTWLAHFHATFMGEVPTGLWRTGTYWHLATRPDELDALVGTKLKAAAPLIDQKLADSPFQTLVHGDAKLANFCFAGDGRVGAVDFQYVGAGCGMKDVAYFISSCLTEDECERRETTLLDTYFRALESALRTRKNPLDFAALEADWRALYPVAWTDFFRFLQGWSPGHWKIHRYSTRLAQQVLRAL